MRSTKGWVRSGGFGFACLFVLLAMLSAAHAQGVGAAASIKGTVSDASGGVMPKANVVAEDAEKGIRRTTTTDSGGEYRFTGLPPATYNVTVDLSGFQTEVQKGMVITVGQTAILDFRLKLASRKETVEVSAEPPVIDTERSSQADTITQAYIGDLPIDRRDYLTFTLLTPGVSDSTRLAGDQDFRVKQTPQSGLSFYGSNGRGNSITVDGGETSGDSGGVRLTVSQDDVQEFQINRSNYAADLGAATGASINIVTKSGTNNVHGSLYGFFRDDVMDAENPFSFSQALAPGELFNPANPDTFGSPIKDTLTRQQFGGNLGFPIQKDKTFLFVSFEGLRQDAQNAVPLLTDTDIFRPTGAQEAIIGQLAASTSTVPITCVNGQAPEVPAVCAFILQNLLTVNPTPNVVVSQGQAALNAFLRSEEHTSELQ